MYIPVVSMQGRLRIRYVKFEAVNFYPVLFYFIVEIL